MARLLSFTCLLALALLSCKKQVIEKRLTGTWKYEYRILDDGTRDYQNPYALLVWNYSDGFILFDDGTGQSMWYDKTNSEKFEWSNSKSHLSMQVVSPGGEVKEYEYLITDVKKNSMLLHEPVKGRRYHMIKKQD